MKIAVRKPRSRTAPRNVRAVKPPAPRESDLPILAAEEAPMQPLDWEALMGDDVQPALLVGGERRWHGRR
jgi:hypothetical protein